MPVIPRPQLIPRPQVNPGSQRPGMPHRPTGVGAGDRAEPLPAGAVRALVLATLGFAVNCWAWALLSPLGPVFVREGIAKEAALLVAVPVLVGSLGRIPIGALADRHGGHVLFPVVAVISAAPVLFIGFVGQYDYLTLLVGAFFLGIAGTSFAIGIPYVNTWFPPGRRGVATGVFGASMGGAALSAVTTIPLLTAFGEKAPFVVTAAALFAYAVLAWRCLPVAPGWSPSRVGLRRQTLVAVRRRTTWLSSYLYAVSFGGYVAFSVYLPTLLSTWYGLRSSEASYGTAGFVLVAVLLRPAGGLLADRIGASRTLSVSFVIVLLGAVLLGTHPGLMPGGTVALGAMAAGLGSGSGALFALLGQITEPTAVGAVTGVVGAAGGLGGFVPPLVMAAVFARTGTYSPAVLLLAVAAIGALVITGILAAGRSSQIATEQGRPGASLGP